MAAPKKTKAKTTAKKATTPKAPAAKKKTAAPAQQTGQDALQEITTTVRSFQVNTLVGLGLAIAFVLFQIFPDARYIWWLNIPAAAIAGYIFWRQADVTKGIEQTVCRYGLLAVALLFLARDIYISERLRDAADYLSLVGQ